MYNIKTLPPPPTGNILCVTDPSEANIYVDGTLQPQKSSVLLTNIYTGGHTISYTRPGYATYTESVTVSKDKTEKVCAILTKIVDITDKGIVICTTPNILSCPIFPTSCPLLVTPLNYINLIAMLNSTAAITLTVRFIYSLNGTINNRDVAINLSIGTNIVYAFPTNTQQPVNTILSLESVILI